MHKKLCIFLLISSVIALCQMAQAEEVRLGIVPFKVNSQDDISYIRDGIASLLPPRIALSGKISIIDRYLMQNEYNKLSSSHPLADEIAIGKKLKADYILTGSITKFGANVSLDTQLIEIASPENATPIFIQSIGLNDMLPQVTAFGETVKKKILLGETETSEPPVTAAAPTQKPVVESPRAETPPSHAEPSSIPATKPPEAVAEEPGIDPTLEAPLQPEYETVVQPRMPKKPPLYESTPFYSSTISGDSLHCITSGDTDGDNNRELLIAGAQRILLYQWNDGEMKLSNEVQATFEDHIVHVDTADTNKNGKDEIFVSSFKVREPNSYVLEFKDKSFEKIEPSQDYFFRIYQPPGKRLMILGQHAGEKNPFINMIFTFAWKNNKLTALNEFLIPESLQLYSFAMGDINRDGRLEYIAFSKGLFDAARYQLHVFSSLGRTLWRDQQQMGGEVNHFIKRMYANDIEQKEFLPMRVLFDDYNRDGTGDVIVGRNSKSSTGILEKMTRYDQGEVFCLHWDGYDLTPNWSSGVMDGYITDYGVFDLDGDGTGELFILSVSEKGFIGKEKNKITVFKQMSQ